MKKLNISALLFILVTSVVTSCTTPVPDPPKPKRVGFYILGEGGLNKNNSTLSLYLNSTGTLISDYFGTQNNGAKIGDTANDMIVYGSKSYIVVNVSNKVVVSNIYSGEVVKEIDFGKEGSNNLSPRYAVAANGKVFVSTYYGGVAVIDTTSLLITKKIALSGAFSENIINLNGKIYVANSGNTGDSFGGSGTTISVIDIANESEASTITVPENPNRLVASKDGSLFVSTWGNWYNVDAQIHKVNTTTKTYQTIDNLTASRMVISDNFMYTFHFSYIAFESYVKKVDLSTLAISTFMEDPSENGFRSIYELSSDPQNGDIYFLDESGLVVVYDKNGTETMRFDNAGTRVNKVVFLDR